MVFYLLGFIRHEDSMFLYSTDVLHLVCQFLVWCWQV